VQTSQERFPRIILGRVAVPLRDHQTCRPVDGTSSFVEFPPLLLGVDDGAVREGPGDSVGVVC
jgi:hypothetical protein